MSTKRNISSRSSGLLDCDCVTGSMPSDASMVRLVAVSSASIEVQSLRLRASDGRLDLEGVVTILPEPWSTEGRNQVDVVFLDATEQRLRVETASVAARNPPNTSRPVRPHGTFSLAIPQLPVGTAKIEVRAHEPRRGMSKRTSTGNLP